MEVEKNEKKNIYWSPIGVLLGILAGNLIQFRNNIIEARIHDHYDQLSYSS